MPIVITCKTQDYLDLEDLTEFQGELKSRTSEDYKKIIHSINKHGFAVPFFVWSHDGINHVLDGHGRLGALHKMQEDGEVIPALPVVYVDCKSEADAKNLLLKITSQYGKMTADSVNDFIEGIEVDIEDLALPSGVLELDINPIDIDAGTGDDEAPEVDEDGEADSELGGLYELGDNLLFCGDSTNPEDLARLMHGVKADLVFTDPPYGMKKENDGVLNDNLNFDDLLIFNKKWIKNAFDNLKDNGSFYCWGTDEPLMDIYSNIIKPMANNNEVTFRNLLTWDKGNGQGQHDENTRLYAIADEKCLFVMKGVQGFNNNSDNYFTKFEPIRQKLEDYIKSLGMSDNALAKEMGYACGRTVNHWYSKSQFAFPTLENYQKLREIAKSHGLETWETYDEIKKDYEQIKKDYNKERLDFYATRAYFDNTWDNFNNVWHFDRTSQKEREDTGNHATPKPIELCERAILTSSREGETVLDLFGGSGSTLIACAKNNRKCLIMELSPQYCDVIRKRFTKWAEENGKPCGSGALK